MTKISGETQIGRTVDIVWKIFTDPSTWEHWYGGAIESVTPGWQIGGEINWKRGLPGTIVEFTPMEKVTLQGSSGTLDIYAFDKIGCPIEFGTRVTHIEDYSKSRLSVTDPAVCQARVDKVLDGLKNYVLTTTSEKKPTSEKPSQQPSQKYCRQCGTELTLDARFCRQCGTQQPVVRSSREVSQEQEVQDLRPERVEQPKESVSVEKTEKEKEVVDRLIKLLDGTGARYDAYGSTLSDSRLEERERAIQALGEIGDPRAIGPLMRMFDASDLLVYGRAVTALSKIGEPSIEPLIKALGSKNENVRTGAVGAFGQMGEPAVEPLTRALGSKDENVRKGAKEALDKIEARKKGNK